MKEDPRNKADLDESYVSRIHFCGECKKPLRRIIGKMGPFWGCTGFPACRFTRHDVDGKPSDEADEHYRCPVCTRRMIRTTDKQGDIVYWYCSGYNKGCDVNLKDENGRPQSAYRCPDCGHLLVSRDGKNGKFWGCSQYPKCNTTCNDKNGKPDLDILSA